MENIKVVQWGLGNMGSGIAKLALQKTGLELVGAVDNAPGKAGKDLGEFLGLAENGVIISAGAEEVIKRTKPHLVILATTSFVKEAYSAIATIVRNG